MVFATEPPGHIECADWIFPNFQSAHYFKIRRRWMMPFGQSSWCEGEGSDHVRGVLKVSTMPRKYPPGRSLTEGVVTTEIWVDPSEIPGLRYGQLFGRKT